MTFPASDRSDSELVLLSLTEDPNVFGDLFDRHAESIGSYFARRVSTDDVAGLLSTVFLTAFKTRANYDVTKSNALPWLYGIARNHLRHHYRSRRREREAMERVHQIGEIDDALQVGFEFASDAALDASRQLEQVKQLLALQPERDREVVQLYAWEELSYEEIAEALAIPVGTVRSRLNRIRRKIRELDACTGQELHQSDGRLPGGSMTESTVEQRGTHNG